jgi:hypothetical protein
VSRFRPSVWQNLRLFPWAKGRRSQQFHAPPAIRDLAQSSESDPLPSLADGIAKVSQEVVQVFRDRLKGEFREIQSYKKRVYQAHLQGKDTARLHLDELLIESIDEPSDDD